MTTDPLTNLQRAVVERMASTRDVVMLYEQRVVAISERSETLDRAKREVSAAATNNDGVRSFRAVLDECAATRLCAADVQDPWLLPIALHLNKAVALVELVNTASRLLIEASDVFGKNEKDLFQNMSAVDVNRAKGYQASIMFRSVQAALYLSGDAVALYDHLRDAASLPAVQVAVGRPDAFQDNESVVSGVLLTAALWALAYKLIGIFVEFDREKGPVLDSLVQHLQIADTSVDACLALLAASKQDGGACQIPCRYADASRRCEEFAVRVEQEIRRPLRERISELKKSHGSAYANESHPEFAQNERLAGELIDQLKARTKELTKSVEPIFNDLRAALPPSVWEQWTWLGVQDRTEDVPRASDFQSQRKQLQSLIRSLALRRNAKKLVEWVEFVREGSLTMEDGTLPDTPVLDIMERLIQWDLATARDVAKRLLTEPTPFSAGTFEVELAGCFLARFFGPVRQEDLDWAENVLAQAAAQPIERYGDEMGRAAVVGSLAALVFLAAPAGAEAALKLRGRLEKLLEQCGAGKPAQHALQFLVSAIADFILEDANGWMDKWAALKYIKDKFGFAWEFPEMDDRLGATKNLLVA